MPSRCHRLAVSLLAAGFLASLPGCIIVSVHRPAYERSTSFSTGMGKRIGVELGDVAPATAAQAGVVAERSSIITRVVTGSAADRAGLQPWDIITHVDGRDWATTSALREAVRSKNVGQTIDLTVVRGGKANTITVVVEHD
jgi:S1-C subfamily serine protease